MFETLTIEDANNSAVESIEAELQALQAESPSAG